MATKMELDLFSKRPMQTDIEDTSYAYFYPLVNPSGNNGPIEFFVPGSIIHYLDLKDTSLGIHARVTNQNGEDLAEGAEVAPVNNWLHSLFSDVSLTLNDSIVEGGSHLYPYKAYLTNLLLFGEVAKKCQLQSSGWAKDQAGRMEHLQNTGYLTRRAWIAQSAVYEMEGPLLLDLCMQGKLLLNQVDVRVKLTRSNNTFHLFSMGDNAVNAKVDIQTAYLKVKQVQVSPDRVRQIKKVSACRMPSIPFNGLKCTHIRSPRVFSRVFVKTSFITGAPKCLLWHCFPMLLSMGATKPIHSDFLTSVSTVLDSTLMANLSLIFHYSPTMRAAITLMCTETFTVW